MDPIKILPVEKVQGIENDFSRKDSTNEYGKRSKKSNKSKGKFGKIMEQYQEELKQDKDKRKDEQQSRERQDKRKEKQQNSNEEKQDKRMNQLKKEQSSQFREANRVKQKSGKGQKYVVDQYIKNIENQEKERAKRHEQDIER